LVKKLGYKVDKIPLWYVESLMTKNFYNDTPELEYPEFVVFLLRFAVENRIGVGKCIRKMHSAQGKSPSLYSKLG
jgi:hypothetical protein